MWKIRNMYQEYNSSNYSLNGTSVPLTCFSKCQILPHCICELTTFLLVKCEYGETAQLKVQHPSGSSRTHQFFQRQPDIPMQERNTEVWHNESSPGLMTQEQGLAVLLCQTKFWQRPSTQFSFMSLTVEGGPPQGDSLELRFEPWKCFSLLIKYRRNC